MICYENVVKLIKNSADQINLDFTLIQRIQIVIYDKINCYMGKIAPISSDNKLYFELLLQQSLIDDLISEDDKKVKIAKNIIQHELFHCKEMSITSTHIDYKKLYFHESISTTRLLLFNTAIHQWSEYYAYYNSAKTNEREIKLSDTISSADASLKVLHTVLSETPNTQDIQILYSSITRIIDFIHICIMLIAHYNSTYSKKYKREFDYIKRSSIYGLYYPYLKDLSYIMHSLYKTYPKWISESLFLELGYKLFSFIKISNITYSTYDLSDNFIFKLYR